MHPAGPHVCVNEPDKGNWKPRNIGHAFPLLASLNHTRHDVRITLTLPRIGTILIYDVRAHDVHHRLPRSNYGQYIMLWDRLMGSYKPYDATI